MSRSNQLAGLLTADPPSALDTINEINTALGNDASLSTTLTNSIATKAPIASPTFTGDAVFDTDTLKVDSSGNKVGIGATSGLLGKLHIQEFGSVAGSVSNGADTLVLQNNGGHGGLSVLTNNTSTASLHLGDTDTSSMGGLQYDNNTNKLSVLSGGAVKATIDSSGKVAIGHTGPITH